MPLPLKFPRHPICRLRKILGLSRAQFAQTIGTSLDTIISIENGRLAVSSKLARRIQFLTGANASELVKGVSGKLLDHNLRPYDARIFAEKRRNQSRPAKDVLELYAREIAKQARKKLTIASEQGRAGIAFCDILEAVEQA